MAETGPVSPLDVALGRVGDRWALLLVASLLTGPRRFNELLAELPGLAPNVLSQRLKHLEREGVIVATPYTRRPLRFSYELTAAGAELAGALALLASWGAGRAEAEETPTHSACGTPMEVHWYCPTCHRLVDDDEHGDLHFV
jgi:DNA-binding HxlR family transcriptional regulator